jgi:cytochrome c peroxidase
VDVGTKKASDRSGMLKSAQLTNIALTAPYLHDGSARTLEEIWTVYNPEDKHGRTNDLTKDELNDLIEYLRTR